MRKGRGQRTTLLLATTICAVVLSGCQSGPSGSSDDTGRGEAGDGSGPGGVEAAPGAAADEDTPPGEITLAFAGDIHFEGAFDGVPDQDGSTLGPMSGALQRADLAIVNLESALTRRGEPASKELEDPSQRYWFRTPPSTLGLLERSGVDVVTLANNHGADYGRVGVLDAVDAGRRSPVGVIGIGAHATQAFKPHRVTVDGIDVAVLAADASPRESESSLWEARPGSGPGLAAARATRPTQLLAAVRSAAARDDVVVVYLHWGEENEACPTVLHKRLAQSLSRAGASVIVGSHAHELQGAGMLNETYVSYGLGNFYWYHGRQPETGVLQVRVDAQGVVDDTLLPAAIPEFGGAPRALAGRARDRALSDWRGLRGCTQLEPGPGASAERQPGPSGQGDQGSRDERPEFTSSVNRISADVRRRMRASHDPATCPVPLSDLRYLRMSYVDFQGATQQGEMVVNRDVARDVVGVFSAMYDEGFPIARMRLVDEYAANDNQSMAANNTSGYNCRTVAGTTTFSDHAFGRAIDINPVQNPYVFGDSVLPPQGRSFVDADRSREANPGPGVIVRGDVVASNFARLGWTWGANFSEPDYQHFSVDR